MILFNVIEWLQTQENKGMITWVYVLFLFTLLDMSEFRELFSKAKHIAIITGAGVSAESGVPTFRGENEKWRKWQSQVVFVKSEFTHPHLYMAVFLFIVFIFCVFIQVRFWVWPNFQLLVKAVAVEWVYLMFT